MIVQILFTIFSLLSLTSPIIADYAPRTCDNRTIMTQVTKTAPWSARDGAGGAYLRQPFTFTPKGASSPVTWPIGTIAIFGGSAIYNDVWASSDNANNWTLISGISRYVEGAYNTAFNLVDGGRTAVCQHTDGTIYIVGGTLGTTTRTSRVARGNLTHWQSLGNQLFIARDHTTCLVDSDNNVYVFGGQRQTPTPAYSTNDIWVGQGGTDFTRLTAAAAWPAREGHQMVIMRTTDLNMSATGEIMIMSSGIYGLATPYRMNDIWASTDRARSWQRLNAQAPWSPRQDGEMAISSTGVLVVAAGDCGSECSSNDIWASMDGGWTWGQCCEHCGFNNRDSFVSMFDRDGYFVLMSGTQTFPDNGLAQDVWRSQFSFNDLSAVSRSCGIPIPTCGVGLKCIPGGYCPCKPRHGKGVVMDIVDIAPWAEGRQEAGMAARTTPLTFMDVSVNPPVSRTFATSIILFGGKLGSVYYNDVWASSDNGNNWSMISGVYAANTSVNATVAGRGNYLRDNSRSADCYDSNGRMYLIAGTNVTTAEFSSSVWASDDGIDWAPMTLNAPFWPREASMCSCDHNNNVYVFGGSVRIYTRNNDVWKSSDGGRNWVQQTERAPWPARTQHDSASYYQSTWQKTILYVSNGIYNSDPAADRNNDIWASSDEGVNWILINKSPQYSSRQDSQTDATSAGVLIVSGGDTGGNTPGNVNDIWASLDGGYNWGICNSSAGYTPREDQSIGFTPEGYMLLTGGDAPWVTRDHNVFRSAGSFNNITYVAESCGLTIPYCGVGLRCWPSATQRCEFGCPARTSLARTELNPFSRTQVAAMSAAADSTQVGCSSTAIPTAGTVAISVIIDSSTDQLYNSQGSQFGSKLLTAMTNTVRSAHPNIQSSMFRCAQISDLSNSRSEATVYILGSSGSNPSASNVYSALQSNTATLNNEIRSNIGVTGSLNAPTQMGPTITETVTERPGTSVGLTVGMAFLGFGVGLLITMCLAMLLCGHSKSSKYDANKPVHRSTEQSSNNPNHEMELSHVQ